MSSLSCTGQSERPHTIDTGVWSSGMDIALNCQPGSCSALRLTVHLSTEAADLNALVVVLIAGPITQTVLLLL